MRQDFIGHNSPSFEELLAKQNKVMATPINKMQTPILKAEKGADLDDFISDLAMILSRTLRKHNAVFVPDEGGIIKDPHNQLEETKILYKVIERVPLKELKPRPMEEIIEDENNSINKRTGMIYGQRQRCILQFDIVACDYVSANKVMKIFEETMFTYTGFFKSKGVYEMHFLKHFSDINYDTYRQDLSVRSLQYYIEIQKLITVFDTTIDNIDVV